MMRTRGLPELAQHTHKAAGSLISVCEERTNVLPYEPSKSRFHAAKKSCWNWPRDLLRSILPSRDCSLTSWKAVSYQPSALSHIGAALCQTRQFCGVGARLAKPYISQFRPAYFWNALARQRGSKFPIIGFRRGVVICACCCITETCRLAAPRADPDYWIKKSTSRIRSVKHRARCTMRSN